MRKGFLAVGLFGLVGVLAACGGGSGSVSSKPSTKPKSSSSNAAATVRTANSSLGTILVAANGRTLYELDKDTPTMSNCTGACTTLWPPLTVTGTPVGGSGVTASMLTVLMDANGTQVVYNGHPLYMFANDHATGDLNGQGFAGNIWHVVSPTGQPILGAVPATTPSTSGSGYSGGGSGY